MRIYNISKSYNTLKVISNISLYVEEGEIVSVVGPSGCGKTTLLNLIAKLDEPDTGNILLSETDRIGYMMQEDLLFPWRTLEENALLGTEVIIPGSYNTREQLDRLFEAFDLASFKGNYPNTASGGMKQRVALIRTLLIRPSLLLMDEPFSNLDFDIKLRIQKQLIRYQQQNKMSILLVTHDIEDAISLSHRIIVLSAKPATIKVEIPIDVNATRQDPIEARKSHHFREYFTQIWDELKYSNLEENS
ncbi:MAG: ABC transporter ATP-binding protein [Symploca sp. SIO1C4]|uniref:ABC transporter ATP-binding protein n=1 Tax=Symploca sp. SIO1C4 TaxID=2607765 RepID=A0A6B3NJ94_9CYAN|nr:ABC transporter ATP-binding protein [Symploca sp. SIO1C4]